MHGKIDDFSDLARLAKAQGSNRWMLTHFCQRYDSYENQFSNRRLKGLTYHERNSAHHLFAFVLLAMSESILIMLYDGFWYMLLVIAGSARSEANPIWTASCLMATLATPMGCSKHLWIRLAVLISCHYVWSCRQLNVFVTVVLGKQCVTCVNLVTRNDKI